MADKKTAAVNAENVKTPKERMQTTGVNRVNSVLEALRILGNVSDRTTYEYTAADWAKIKAAIATAVSTTNGLFDDALAGKSKKTIKAGFGL